MAPRPGWKSSLYQTVYERYDPALAGYGNPPSDPQYQIENPGSGSFPLISCVVDTKNGKLVEVTT